MRTQHRCDLGAVDVLTTRDDHVGLAVDDVEVSLVVHAAEVTGVEPAVGEGPLVGLGHAPVALHHGRSAVDDLPDLAHRHIVPVLVDDAQIGRASRRATAHYTPHTR